MNRKVWLINLFGTPCAPSSFCPDNSLAALAGSLKQAGYFPVIHDFQTIDFCSQLVPKEIGQSFASIVAQLRQGKEEKNLPQKISKLQNALAEHQHKILDKIVADFFELYKKEQPLFLGFKLYSGEGNYLVSELVKKLKAKNWPTKIIGGGPLLRVVGKDYFHCFDGFDFLIDGEAERAIVKFAKMIEGNASIHEIPGLIYRNNNKIYHNENDRIDNINELVAPLYDEEVYPALYKKNQKAYVFQIDDSRGCPNTCSFCVHPSMNGQLVRCRHAKEIVNQMAELQKRFGAYCFRFTGSNTPKKLLREVTNEILSRGLDVRYSCYASINMTSIEEIRKFKVSGLCGLFIGVETLDEYVLNNIFKKKQDNEDAKRLVKSCLEEDIYTTTSWIYPAPHQSKSTKDEIVKFLVEAYSGRSPDEGSIMLIPPAVIPNSDWFNNPQEFGFNIPSKIDLIKSYANLRFNMHIPRRLIGNLGFDYNGSTFFDLQDECDKLQFELTKHNLPLNITDDWMLLGKLSGYSVREFQKISSNCLVTGDYRDLEKLISNINTNSKLKNWQKRPLEKVA